MTVEVFSNKKIFLTKRKTICSWLNKIFFSFWSLLALCSRFQKPKPNAYRQISVFNINQIFIVIQEETPQTIDVSGT